MTNDMDIEMDEMQEIIDDFLVEADELISSLDTNLVKLETSPDDLNLLNEIFRAAHTIKGTSSFLGFDQVTSLTHKMEDILNKLRKGEMVVTPDIMDLLLESLDILKVLLDHVREKVTEEIDLTGITGRLVAAQEAGCGDTAVADDPPAPISDSALEAEIAAAMSLQPEEMTAEAPPDGVVKATPVAETAKIDTKAAPQPKKPASDQTIRVDVERLDSLMNMMGELVLARNSLMQTQNFLNQKHDGDSELDTLNQATNSVNFITTELQMAVMKMRMLPIGKVFRKFPRLVRDLARDSKKQIDLVIEGETTELDKTVIEEIGDPLVHIIRNSCDHGIESPEERTTKGKPAKGLIRLEAAQEGSNIVIKIIDDGRGFDVDAIRDKVVERGLASREEVDRMPDREAFAYTFQAGFSTAKKITDVSGRGVGMDVVRTNIEKLNG
ncbi:MAG: chemotaxis protein CheA, partial [candidate division Zixibacteria bacterium]|nr:chemotaxis protein CheA [candidate division Zixibacteria bacterium]